MTLVRRIFVITGLAFFSRVLKLEVLALLLNTTFAASAFAALVIFQPELRRMLAELGNLPLFNTAREQRENIEVTIQAVERMSEVRIGAIIAIQQSIQLQDVV